MLSVGGRGSLSTFILPLLAALIAIASLGFSLGRFTIDLSRINPWLLAGSSIATIVTAFAAVFALIQIRVGFSQLKASLAQIDVAKKDIELRSRREAGVLGCHLCERWAGEIIPLSDQVFVQLQGKFAPGQPKEFLNSELEEPEKRWIKYTEEKQLHIHIINLLNKIESVAMYLERELADEDLAFGPLATGFVITCQRLWPWIAAHRPDESHRLYPNTVELYKRWRDRLHKAGLDLQNRKIQEQIAALPPTPPKKPIGTSVK